MRNSLKTFAVSLLAVATVAVVVQPAQGQGCRRGHVDGNMAYVFGSWDTEQSDEFDFLGEEITESTFPSYRLGNVQGGGNSREHTLSGLERIWIPSGETGFAAEWGEIPAPNVSGAGGEGQNVNVDPKIPEEVGHVTGNSCMDKTQRGLYFRGGVVLDKRWEANVGSFLACQVNPFCDHPYDYIGIPLRSEFQNGTDWPVQHYVVSNWRAAERAADKVEAGEAGLGDPAAVQTFDFELWGEVQRVEIPDEHVPDGCDPPLGIGLLGGDDCPDWRYRRIWRGNIWMLSYNDPRVDTHGWPEGQANRGTGGIIHEFAVNFSATVYKEDWDFMEEMESRVQALCGTAEGCGGESGFAPDSAQLVKSEDGETQQEQLCQTAIRTSDKFQAGDCEIGEDNRYTGDLEIDEAALQEKLNSDLNLPGVSEGGKDATDTGQREDSVMNVPSQFNRRCLEEIREDSIRRANTPGDFESDIPDMCDEILEQMQEEGTGSGSVQAASTTSAAASARQQLARECQAIIQRWQRLEEDGQLPEDTEWEDMVPEACQPYM